MVQPANRRLVTEAALNDALASSDRILSPVGSETKKIVTADVDTGKLPPVVEERIDGMIPGINDQAVSIDGVWSSQKTQDALNSLTSMGTEAFVHNGTDWTGDTEPLKIFFSENPAALPPTDVQLGLWFRKKV